MMPTRTLSALGLAACLLAGILLASRGRGEDPAARKKILEGRLRQLEKDIAAVRGLAFKKPVVAHVIARPPGASKHLQGYYSPREKALFLYDDLAGPYERGVLIHEMVHALQDQHFGLDRLHPPSFEDDADLARAALIEGDATFTMIELLRKDQPRVAAMLDAPLVKARDLQKAFLYAQGARYVQALRKQGGWEAVNRRYRFPPDSTAAVLHPDEAVTAIDIGPGKTVGELGLIALLAGHPGTAPEAVTAASGWRGDRLREDRTGKSWTLAFATPAQADRFAQALARLRPAEDPDLKEIPAGAGTSAWRGTRGNVLAVSTRGARVLVLEAPDRTSYRALRERAEGPLSLCIYSARDRKALTFGELTDRLLRADLVCIGETHDSDLHHRVQLQIIKALFACDERLGVGMEIFQRPFQKSLDRYLAGDLSEDDLLRATEYRQRWGFDWSLYRPLAEFCRRNGIPVAALNAPRELTRRVSQVGYAGLTAQEKEQLGPVDFHVKEHRAYWYDRLAKMHGQGKAGAEQKERSYQVMTVWDEYMADSAARFQKERRLRRLVVLAGSGHVERSFGIPNRAARRTGGQAATVRIEVGTDLDKVKADPAADFVVLVR
jgi:uncharacterized iron-regulated protein